MTENTEFTNDTVSGFADELTKALGQLALTEQRLRDLVEAGDFYRDKTSFDGSVEMLKAGRAINAARELLEGEGK